MTTPVGQSARHGRPERVSDTGGAREQGHRRADPRDGNDPLGQREHSDHVRGDGEPELGGDQLPRVVATACFAWLQAANVGTSAYPKLTPGKPPVAMSRGENPCALNAAISTRARASLRT
jgi:hypothetical protein